MARDKRRMDELRQAYEATTYRAMLPSDEVAIRVGDVCPQIDDLLDDLGMRNWAFISAANPGSMVCEPAENLARHALLLEYVTDMGWRYFPGQGVPDDIGWEPEASALILGIEASVAVGVGRRFGQFAIVRASRGEPARLAWC